MSSLDTRALEAASRAFRRMHNSVCYPSASESEANWAASEIVSAYLAAIEANTKSPDSDLSSLRKGAEVVEPEDDFLAWAYDTLREINVSNYDHDDVCRLNDASVEVILAIAARRVALVSGSREDG